MKLAIKLYRMYRTAFYTIKFKLTNMQSGVHTTWAYDFWASKMFEESLISNLNQNNLHMIIMFEEKNNGEKIHRQVYVNDIMSSLTTSLMSHQSLTARTRQSLSTTRLISFNHCIESIIKPLRIYLYYVEHTYANVERIKWESFEEPWHQNAASGEKWIRTPDEKLTTSDVVMSGFFEGLPL